MHAFLPTQWVTAIPFWRHDTSALGERCIAQSAEAPPARDFPIAPRRLGGWMGHTGESPAVSGEGRFSESGEGGAEAIPNPATSGNFRGVATK
jgi:hypothetical protein